MFELRLFPLNTVLFPKMPLPLHIFEERYKLMITECMEADEPFGVVLIEEGSEAFGPLAQPHAVGCTARVVQVESLEDGRMNIITIGQERFRTHTLDDSKPYLAGSVEPFPFADTQSELIPSQAHTLARLYERYLRALSSANLVNIEGLQLPNHPIDLAYSAAHVLQVPQRMKQAWLEVEAAPDFLQSLIEDYRLEVPLMETTLSRRPPDDSVSFSQN